MARAGPACSTSQPILIFRPRPSSAQVYLPVARNIFTILYRFMKSRINGGAMWLDGRAIATSGLTKGSQVICHCCLRIARKFPITNCDCGLTGSASGWSKKTQQNMRRQILEACNLAPGWIPLGRRMVLKISFMAKEPGSFICSGRCCANPVEKILTRVLSGCFIRYKPNTPIARSPQRICSMKSKRS